MRSMDMEDTAHYMAGHTGDSESALVNLTEAWYSSMPGLAARAREVWITRRPIHFGQQLSPAPLRVLARPDGIRLQRYKLFRP